MAPSAEDDDTSTSTSSESEVDPSDWGNFVMPELVYLEFSEHVKPTRLFTSVFDTHNDLTRLLPYTDPFRLFRHAHTMSSLAVPLYGGGSNDLTKIWMDILLLTLNPKSTMNGVTRSKILFHVLKLAMTPPSIFGDNSFRLKESEQQALFRFAPLSATCVPVASQDKFREILNHRHDIVQWIACFRILGKAFTMDGWEVPDESVEILVSAPDPSRSYLKVTSGSESIMVSQDAWDSMNTAVDYMANQPGPFFKAKFAVIAVAKILGQELLSYSMPQTADDLNSFDWSGVILGRMDTYPKAPKPPKSDFNKVRLVHDFLLLLDLSSFYNSLNF